MIMFQVLMFLLSSAGMCCHIISPQSGICLQQIKLLVNSMESNFNSTQQQRPVYGFLCQATNIFYAFETFEQYQEFLGWLQAEESSRSLPSDSAMASQEELQRNFEMATANIMDVFKDPLFTSQDMKMELEQIDF